MWRSVDGTTNKSLLDGAHEEQQLTMIVATTNERS